MESASILRRPAFLDDSFCRSSLLLRQQRAKEERSLRLCVCSLNDKPNPNSKLRMTGIHVGRSKMGVPVTNYVAPLDASTMVSSCITRPLVEILRDLNKRLPDNTIKPNSNSMIPWYHANRMLSFYAPGWCGEIRDVIYSNNGSVTVVYRVTIRGSDGEVHRESVGTVSSIGTHIGDPVAAAEEIAFCRACARFGLGLYLYHEDNI